MPAYGSSPWTASRHHLRGQVQLRHLLAPLIAASTLVLTSSGTPASTDDAVISPHTVAVACGPLAPATTSAGHQQRWRQSFGLPCDQSTVAAIEGGDHVTLQQAAGLEIAISSAEQSALAQREIVRQAAAAPEFTSYAESLPGFGGLYFDHAAGGIATVLYTADPRQRWDALARRFAYSEFLTVRRVAHSFADLVNLQRRIAQDIPTIATLRIAITSLDIDVANNAVAVRVDGDASAAEQRLIQRYGPAVHVEYGPPPQLEPFQTKG